MKNRLARALLSQFALGGLVACSADSIADTPITNPPSNSSYVVAGTRTTWNPEPWIIVVSKQPVRGVKAENGLCSYHNIELPAQAKGVSAKLGEYDTATCEGVVYFVIFPKDDAKPIQVDSQTFRFPRPIVLGGRNASGNVSAFDVPFEAACLDHLALGHGTAFTHNTAQALRLKNSPYTIRMEFQFIAYAQYYIYGQSGSCVFGDSIRVYRYVRSGYYDATTDPAYANTTAWIIVSNYNWTTTGAEVRIYPTARGFFRRPCETGTDEFFPFGGNTDIQTNFNDDFYAYMGSRMGHTTLVWGDPGPFGTIRQTTACKINALYPAEDLEWIAGYGG